jgi:putative hydrolase of the HAD superfamily
MDYSNIKVIAFDGDDTLWVNETFYRESEKTFYALLKDHIDEKDAERELFKTEMDNLPLYGYGTKGFMLSMIETAIRISGGKISAEIIAEILQIGKKQIEKPVELIDGVETVLRKLKSSYKIIIATKGDLLDQQRKLKKSGLADIFDHIEIMSDKQEADYNDLIRRLNIHPENFLMVGNSLKSDVLPVIKVGGKAVYIPFHTTWVHEQASHHDEDISYLELETINEILNLIL